MRLKESTTTCGSAELDLHAEHPRRELPRYRRLLVRTFSSRRSRAGIQKGKCPTSRVRPVLYLQTGAMFALAAPRRAGPTSRLAHQLRSFAMLAAMRRASSRVAGSPPRSKTHGL